MKMPRYIWIGWLVLGGCRQNASEDTGKLNQTPTISISSHNDGDTVLGDEIVTWYANVADLDHLPETLEVEWTVNDAVACPYLAPDADGLSTCASLSLEEGDAEIMARVRDPKLRSAYDIVRVAVELSQPPTGQILSPLATETYFTDDMVLFSGQLADTEDSVESLQATWKSSIDGELPLDGEIDSTGKFQAYGYLSPGAHIIELEVKDSSGNVSVASVSIEVRAVNSAPTCSILSPQDGDVVLASDSILFEGMIADVDTAATDLEVEFSSDKDGVFGSAEATSNGQVLFFFDGLTSNDHLLTMTVTDPEGANCTDTIVLAVGTPPSLSVLQPTANAVVQQGEGVVFSAQVSDAEDAPEDLSVLWVSDLDGVLSTTSVTSSGIAQFSKSDLSTGMHTISVSVTDTTGLVTDDVFSFSVNSLPTAPTVVVSPDPAQTNDTLTAMASDSIDTDGDSISYHYVWYQNGIQTSNTTASVAAADTTKGELWTVRVTPNDGIADGNYSESSITIANSNPVVASVAISPLSPSNSDEITCSAQVSDPDNEVLQESYQWVKIVASGQPEESTESLGSGQTLQLSTSIASAGDIIQCGYATIDSDGAVAVGSATVTVANSPPVISAVDLSISEPTNDSLISCSVTASDADGDSLSHSFQWTNLTTGLNLASGQALQLDASLVSAGDELQCTVTVTDSSGDSDTHSTTAMIKNLLPVIANVSISPSSAVDSDSSLNCTASGNDPDGSIVATSYAWTNVTTGMVIGATADIQLSPSTASPGDVLQCTATVVDNSSGEASHDATVVVENRQPYFASAAVISPNTGVVVGSSLICDATAVDDDGLLPTVTYVWHRNGGFLASGNNYVLTSDSNPNDTLACTVTAVDIDGGIATSTATVVVENTGPQLTSVAISQSSPTNNSQISCTANVSDADGDALAIDYVWRNTTTAVDIGAQAVLQLDASLASAGDVLSCTATVTDPYGGTATASETVTLGNTFPSINTMTISPQTNIFNDAALTCSATGSDADGSIVAESYVWHNVTTGLVIGSAASLQLSSAHATPGDVLQCQATLTDDSGGSVSDTLTLTVENRAPVFSSPTAITPNASVVVGSELVCDATITDEDGNTVSTSYTWQRNGVFLSSSSTISVASDSQPNDVLSCTILAEDGYGGSTSTSASVSVENSDPVIATVTISQSSPTNDSLVSCAVSAADINNDVLSESFVWSNLTTGATLGLASSLQLDPGTISSGHELQCRVTVTDPYGGTDSHTASVTIGNIAPVISAIQISPNSAVDNSDLLTCSATANDSDGSIAVTSYSWENLTTASVIGSSANVQLSSSISSPGDVIRCLVTVTDDSGDSSSQSTSITVENRNPSFSSAAVISPNSGVVTGSSLSCNAAATDDDGGSPTVSYEWQQNGNFLATGTSLTLNIANSDPGDTIGCVATAHDSDGGSSTSMATVTVENTVPNFTTDAAITPNSGVLTNSSVSCAAIAADADDDTPALSYVWSNVTQNTILGTQATLSLNAASVQPGESIQCTVTATDSEGGSDTSTASLQISNSAPVMTLVSITPSSPQKDDLLTCVATATDPDDETPSLSFTWQNLSTSVSYTSTTIGVNSATLDLSAETVSMNQVIACTATATDSNNSTDSATTTVTIGNSGPQFTTAAAISPSSGVQTGSALTCSATVTDPDDGSLTPSFRWLVGANEIATGASYTVLAADTNVGDTIVCESTATDSNSQTVTSTTSVLLENTSPSISGTTISPSIGVVNDDVLSCSSVLTEPDEVLTATFAWALNGSLVANGSSLDLTTTAAMPNDTVTCTSTATDSLGASATDSTSIVVTNRAPQAPTVSITPAAPVGRIDDLICNIDVESVDLDGDTPSYLYAWTRDGNATSHTSNTVPAADTDVTQQWVCTVTPNDGLTNGSTASASVTTVSGCVFGDCDYNVYLTSSIGLDLVEIGATSFVMGSDSAEQGRDSDETQHLVTLTYDFYMMNTEITQGMFEFLLSYTPWDDYTITNYGISSSHPAYQINWHEVAAFANAVTAHHNTQFGTNLQDCYSCSGIGSSVNCTATGNPYQCTGYRLPTEAEWEFAARGGSTNAIWTATGGEDVPVGFSNNTTILTGGSNATEYAWFLPNNSGSSGQSTYGTKSVAQKLENDFGLFDMSGNVWEWCSDIYGNYPTEPQVDPTGALSGSQGIIRGGYWYNDVSQLRSANRFAFAPGNRYYGVGARLVRSK